MNCRQGDIAIVIHLPHAGMIVEVLEAAIGNRSGESGWMVRLQRPTMVYRVGFGNVDLGRQVSDVCFCADAWLRPIRGESETQPTEEELTA